MPNLRRSIVGPLDALGGTFSGKRGLHLQASDGRTVTLTRADVAVHYASEVGTRVQRRAATLAWVKQQVVASLGAEQIDQAGIAGDFDETTGEVTVLEVS